MVKNTVLGTWMAWVRISALPLTTSVTWASSLMSLCLSFLIFKIPHRIVERIEWPNVCRGLRPVSSTELVL